VKTQEEMEYEERVKRRVLILRDLMQQGKIHFAESIRKQVEKSFLRARFDKNGEPDLSTIDGFIRSTALMVEHINHRTKLKDAISLMEIQCNYFSIIDDNFSHFYKAMIDKKSSPHQIANYIAYHTNDIENLNEAINPLLENIQNYWDMVAESGYMHLEDDYKSIKAVFGGDLFPQHNENIASKCGLYTDTIVLPCPFMRAKGLFERWGKQDRVFYLLKLALNILQYKDLALADLEKPIVVILPDKEMLDEFLLKQVQELGEKDTLFHAKKVFGREFSDIKDLIDFGKDLNTVDKVINEIKDSTRVLFDTEFKESLKIQIENQIKGQTGQLMGTDNPGIIVSMQGLGRMSVCNELLLKSLQVHGVPLIDAPTSWEYFKWKLEYDSERAFPNREFGKLHLVKGLTDLEHTKLNWVGKIPPRGLIEIRKSGAIDEIRSILSTGIDELTKSNELDFSATSNRVFENIDGALRQHQENIKQLKNKKWKIAGHDFGSWIVVGSVEIAAACVGTPLFGVSALILDQFLDAPKIKDLPKSVKQIKNLDEQKNALRQTPMGLIFKYK
jgi:hypothetical protein